MMKPDATEVDICGKMADWLTNSSDRDGGAEARKAAACCHNVIEKGPM
jgi:hypothetical protein